MVQTITRRHVCFATIIEGNLATRERSESALFARLAAARIAVSMVAVNDVGCTFAVDEYDLDGLRAAVQELNVALRLRTRCARITVSRRGNIDRPLPSIGSVIAVMAEAGIGIIHLAVGTDDVSVLVDERDAVRTQAVLAQCAVAMPRTAA
jgi:aspartokinase